MSEQNPSRLWSAFRLILKARWLVIAVYAILLGPAAYFAMQVPQDNSIDRLIVRDDPDYLASRDFAKVFGESEYVILLAEADDPYQAPVLQRVDDLEQRLRQLPRVSVNSALSIYRRAKAGFTANESSVADFKKFATGTQLFRKQGLIGDHFLSVALVLAVKDSAERQATLQLVEAAIADLEKSPAPLSRLRKVGQPIVNAYLDQDTQRAGMRYFPLFFLFVVVLNVGLYRSWQALVAFIVTLAVCAAFTVGFVGLTGGVFTIVSSLVPMTILIVCTATLVYLHSRYVDRPPDRSVEDHQIFALCNKFLACTASIVASAVGFAALAVSKIRPIREMGLWVAVGLMITWVTVFTLFPALVRVLRCPTGNERQIAGVWFEKLVGRLPLFSYRHRYSLVFGSLLLCGVGAAALFGIPGVLPAMKLETAAIEYIPHDSDMYKNTKELEKLMGGLSITNIWLSGKPGMVSSAPVLRGLVDFQQRLDKEPEVGSATSVVTILSTLRYLSGSGDALPTDDAGLEALTDTLENQLGKEPLLQSFVEKTNVAQTHFAVVSKTQDFEEFQKLAQILETHWKASVAAHPALGDFKMRPVGLAPLQAKISHHMVPTLVESFVLTVGIIFVSFLLVFRSGIARVMAMIPSFFAILVMFLFMRSIGVFLNVATILIATTVLGTSENDQIHFFYHFQEGKKDNASTEQALRHTLLISGKAIFFATLINAGGFLAFAFSTLPPIRQFGILSSVSFVLSMIADFTALPASLWLLYRSKPDALLQAEQPALPPKA
ncbi:MAG: MMPL family transporter [Polyangia bacterium]